MAEQGPTVLGLNVHVGVGLVNILAVAGIVMTSIILNTFLNAQLVFLLTNVDYFGVPQTSLGQVTGMLNMVGYPGAVVGSIFAGYVFDIFGRRGTITVSLAVCSVLVATVPWTAPNIWPGLVILKTAIQLMICVHVTNPLAADYIQGDALGRGHALAGIGVVFGEVLCLGVLFKVTAGLDPKAAFACAGTGGLLLTLILFFMIKEPDTKGAKSVNG